QFIERFLFVRALRILEVLNLVENLAKISGGIDGQFVANIDAQDAGEIAPEHGRFAVEIELACLYELANRNHFFFLGRVYSANDRRQTLVLEFDYDRALHEWRRRDHVRCAVDLLLKRSPVAHDVLAFHQNVRVEINYLLPQLTIETAHYRNHKNQHSHAERDADNRDQRDDGEKCAFRFEITQGQEKAERRSQVAVMLAANAPVYNPTASPASTPQASPPSSSQRGPPSLP